MSKAFHSQPSSRGTDYASRSDAGFTLLELLVVIFLITLIAGLSAVFFSRNLSFDRLNATAREMSATIRYARSLAQLHGEKQIVTIDIDSKFYGLAGRGNKSIPPEVAIKIIDPLAGEIHREKYRIVLNEFGGVEGGTIVLSRDKKVISIELDPVVGTVIIK